MLKDLWNLCEEPVKNFVKVFFGLLMLASLITWIVIISNVVSEKDALAELVENPCALVVEYTKDGEIYENHLDLENPENDSFEVASFDEGTTVSVCLTIFNTPEEDAKRFYIKIGNNNAE